MQKEFPALEKYLSAEPKFKIKPDLDNLEEDIEGHWIFNAKFTPEEKDILKQFNPNSVAFMNLEQRTALYKKKALKDIDPKNRLYDVLNDKIDETIKKYYA